MSGDLFSWFTSDFSWGVLAGVVGSMIWEHIERRKL